MDAFLWPSAAVAITAMIAFAGLRAWRGWLDLRRYEIGQAEMARREVTEPTPAARIEIASPKERLRRLEEIAAGVDP